MSIDQALENRMSVGVIVQLNTVDANVISSVAKCFDCAEGTRGAALKAGTNSSGGKDSAYKSHVRVFKKLGVAYGSITSEGLKNLEQHEAVTRVAEADGMRLIRPVPKLAATSPKSPPKGVTWGIKALNVEGLWADGWTGKGILIGHLDTGIDGAHPMLSGAIEKSVVFDVSGRKHASDNPPIDTGDHGTHTAGIIAGRSYKGVVVGVAPEAKLLSAEVIEGGDTVARVLAGMDWILENGANIINLSLGWPTYTDGFLMIMDALRKNQCLPVVAAGNEGEGSTRSPGNYMASLSVGAFSKNNTIPWFSSSEIMKSPLAHIVPDIVGPGDDIWSAAPGGGFQLMSGTSMATPFIAGLAALLMQARPNATIDQIESAIFVSASRAAAMTEARSGRGIPDAVKALKAL